MEISHLHVRRIMAVQAAQAAADIAKSQMLGEHPMILADPAEVIGQLIGSIAGVIFIFFVLIGLFLRR